MPDEKPPILDYRSRRKNPSPSSAGNPYWKDDFAYGIVGMILLYVIGFGIVSLINRLLFQYVGTTLTALIDVRSLLAIPILIAIFCCIFRPTRALGLGMLTLAGVVILGEGICSGMIV